MLIKGTLYKFLRNNLSKTKFFWKYRHLYDPTVWKSYREDYSSSRRKYYTDVIKKYNLKSVFEFGCASGPNYLSIKSNHPKVVFFGYDISKSAIQQINHVNSREVFFSNKISIGSIEDFLSSNGLNKFDLAIFDRVLYMLPKKDIEDLLNKYSKYFKYLIIEDFHTENPRWDSEKYIFAQNYMLILEKYKFSLLENKKSEMQSLSAGHFARRLLFIKE
jgi:SAM-dependent methyltransferase